MGAIEKTSGWVWLLLEVVVVYSYIDCNCFFYKIEMNISTMLLSWAEY